MRQQHAAMLIHEPQQQASSKVACLHVNCLHVDCLHVNCSHVDCLHVSCNLAVIWALQLLSQQSAAGVIHSQQQPGATLASHARRLVHSTSTCHALAQIAFQEQQVPWARLRCMMVFDIADGGCASP